MSQTSAKLPRALKGAEVCLWVAGLVAVGYCGFIEIRAWLAQAEGDHEIDTGAAKMPKVSTGSIVGRLEIPRLGTSVVVFEGTDPGTLDLGAGHWSGSPLPGENGNVVVAAHRDTFFRSLRKIRDQDAVDVATTEGTRHYLVESTQIVNPNDVAVLAPTAEPSLTLITCYPFEYFGHAPKRFIVRARLAEGR